MKLIEQHELTLGAHVVLRDPRCDPAEYAGTIEAIYCDRDGNFVEAYMVLDSGIEGRIDLISSAIYLAPVTLH